ncbi:MAG TPA: class I SAM-dependent methyltransferase [Phycisphaerae bacterium]|nr:class I SAM-dependent methyltransferase [Phycisphaerae bacterium]
MQRQPEPEWMDLPDEAEAYAKADFADVNAAFVERLVELARNVGRAVAVDLGSGPGDIPVQVGRICSEWRILAVDVSHAMLCLAARAITQAGLDRRVLPVEADAKLLPLPDRHADVVFSNSILHHITDADRLWTEIRRIAAPGASIFVRDLARPADEQAARRIVDLYAGNESVLLQEEFYRSLLSAYTPDEVRAQLRLARLDTLQVAMVTDRHLDIWGRFIA